MELKCHGISVTGHREENQDNFFVDIFQPEKGCLKAMAAVFDGMGGQMGGQTASRLAKKVLEESLGEPPVDNHAMDAWLRGLTRSIQATLEDESGRNQQYAGMGTTMVVAAVTEDTVWVANVGDSRTYRVTETGTEQLTADHTAVQDAIDRGLYKLEDILDNPTMMQMDSALIRNLGKDGKPEPDIYQFPLQSGEAFLLCSDGLSGSLTKPLISLEEIQKHIFATKNLKIGANNLASLAFRHGSTDNITVILLETGTLNRAEKEIEKLRSVETLQKRQKQKREAKIEFLRQRALYKKLIPIGVILTGLMLLVILLLLMKKSPESTISVPTQVNDQKNIRKKIAPVKTELKKRVRKKHPLSVEWSNYSPGEIEMIRKEESLLFTIYNLDYKNKFTIRLNISKNQNMKPLFRTFDLTSQVKKGNFNIPLNTFGIYNGKWSLQLILKKNNHQYITKTRHIDVVGQ